MHDSSHDGAALVRSLVDGIPGAVAIVAPGGELRFANRELAEYVGAAAAAAARRMPAEWVHAMDLERVREGLAHSFATGAEFAVEQRLQRADGEYRWFHVRGTPVRDAAGQISSWCFLHTDIEDRKRAEEALELAYRDFNDAQRLSRTGSYTNDYVAGRHMWSDELYRIFEFEPGSTVTTEAALAAVHPDDRAHFAAAFEKSANDGTDVDVTYRIVTASGKTKHLHAVAHISGWREQRPIIIGAVQDVTDTKLAEAALDNARSELAHAARVMSLGALTASIAHEVSQPLSGILTNANVCLRLLSADPPDVEGARDTARRTYRDGNRASEVIARLRALFSKKKLAADFVDLNEAVREVIALSGHELRRQSIALATSFADPPPLVSGDRIQLQQVIINLILNAVEAMSGVAPGARRLFVETARDEASTARVSVRDAGIGLGADSLERIFDPFFTTKAGGMGIGLSISRSIAERHGGRLWAAPNDGPGATFTLAIPCVPHVHPTQSTDVQAPETLAR